MLLFLLLLIDIDMYTLLKSNKKDKITYKRRQSNTFRCHNTALIHKNRIKCTKFYR